MSLSLQTFIGSVLGLTQDWTVPCSTLTLTLSSMLHIVFDPNIHVRLVICIFSEQHLISVSMDAFLLLFSFPFGLLTHFLPPMHLYSPMLSTTPRPIEYWTTCHIVISPCHSWLFSDKMIFLQMVVLQHVLFLCVWCALLMVCSAPPV